MNEEEGGGFERQDRDHPLLNDLILDNIFQYARRRDLLGYRGVCKKWNLLTIRLTRSKFTIGVQLSNESLHHPRNPMEESTRRIEDFVEVFKQNILGMPFAKFKLGPFYTTSVIGQQFLTLCGDTTTDLDLRQNYEGNEVFKVEDVAQVLRSMKKLEKLKIYGKLVTDSGNVVKLFQDPKPKLSALKSLTLDSDVGVYEREGIDYCPTFIEELIKAAENISDLTVEDYFRPPVDNGVQVQNLSSNSFQVFSAIENLGKESSIRSLTLHGVRMTPLVETLHRMAGKPNGLKLKKLSIYEVEEGSDNFLFVELFKDTLEEIDRFGSTCPNFTNFPKMPKLGRLYLEISSSFDSSLVNLETIFPVLNELQLDQGYRDEVYKEFFPQSEACPTMKSLKLLNGLHLRISAFNDVLTVFPGLTELQIDVGVDGVEIVRQIWTRMTQLESLSIRGELQTMESLDTVFTGISTEGIQEITGVLNDLDKMTVQCRRDTILKLRNQHCQLPSIGNLTNLRCLELNVSGNGHGSRFSDVTGFLGFYSLNHLSRLVIHASRLTKTCCEILRTEMEAGLETWTFTTPGPGLGFVIPDCIY